MLSLSVAFALSGQPAAVPSPFAVPPSSDNSLAEDVAPRRRRLAADVITWNKSMVLTPRVGLVILDTTRTVDGIDDATDQSSNELYLALDFTYPLAKWFVLGTTVGATPWELDNAASSGYGTFWALDVSLVPRLRLPFGRRGRGGVLIGVPAGLTLNIAPTGDDDLFVVREKAGLGVGWHVGAEIGFFSYISRHVGLQFTTMFGRQNIRHHWWFSTDDGTLADQRQTVRYHSERGGVSLSLLVAF